MTEYVNQPTLEEVKWKDVREAVRKVNPEFAEIIDKINPGNKFVLYKARYPFGSYIIDSDQFYLPNEGKLIPLTDPRIPKKVQLDLGYNDTGIPLGINLTHSSELYLKSKDRIIPFGLLTKGRIFGLWVALQHNLRYSGIKMWSMVAGTRSLFVLPKITDTLSYKKLAKARGIKQLIPRTLMAHGTLLAEIAHHQEFPTPWFTEVLFFTHNWLEKRNDNNWLNFWLFLYQEGWNKTEYWRTKFGYDFVWDSFVKQLSLQNIRVTPNIAKIIEHIMMVASGELPGFSPAIDNEEGPIEEFEADLINIYGLKRFAPTIMTPKHLSPNDGRFVYLSLQFPTYLESTPKLPTSHSIVFELHEIMNLLQRFRLAVLEEKIEGVKGTSLFELIKKARFDFFHSDIGPDDMIRPISEMVEEDKSLINCHSKYGLREFSEISPFVRGCIRIGF